MPKGLPLLSNADVRYALAAMGHGDEPVIADLNVPAVAVARATVPGRLLRLDGASAPEVVAAVRMAAVDDPDAVPPVQEAVQREVDRDAARSALARRVELATPREREPIVTSDPCREAAHREGFVDGFRRAGINLRGLGRGAPTRP